MSKFLVALMLLLSLPLVSTATATTIRFDAEATKASVSRVISIDPLQVEGVQTVADIQASFQIEKGELTIDKIDYYTIADLDGNREVVLSIMPDTYTLSPVSGDVDPPAQLGLIDIETALGETGRLGIRIVQRLQSEAQGYREKLQIDGTYLTVYEREFSPFDAGRYWMLGSSSTSNDILTGDVNDDLITDGLDLGILLANWGQGAAQGSGNINQQGLVDGLDLGSCLRAGQMRRRRWRCPHRPYQSLRQSCCC